MKALICGVTGQDGCYLARLLLDKGYQLWGTSRDAATASRTGLKALAVDGRLNLMSMAPSDFRSVLTAVEASDADEIYCLSGQTSVGLSFEQPTETLESITNGVLNLLEAIRLRKRPVRFYNAGSSESFGDTAGRPADETTPFRPRSPYGVAKASAHWLVTNYREAYGLCASTGILFNHESPLRAERFVTQKIIRAAKRIAAGSDERLPLGRLDIYRDWGWAPEYVDAMWRILQQDRADDFVIATGEANSLAAFVEEAFSIHGLDWRNHVDSSPALMRPTDISFSVGDPERAHRMLGWRAQFKMRDVIRHMSCAACDP